ncbi:hypothetical protein CROQUDRAFT_546817 [Cronartium quercuum f. sp. fusiforme G11]|uniref:Secreted protein n=1 Tax=Cronartium quercuum f. sp. fusiforme G11 TaxID=708437 RepID=A0A9P6NFP6_9BASI|nr:hypothetical protein CROQUDRAFT_546817 [Cronartium quercuum f. sp. fusiforme G11]
MSLPFHLILVSWSICLVQFNCKFNLIDFAGFISTWLRYHRTLYTVSLFTVPPHHTIYTTVPDSTSLLHTWHHLLLSTNLIDPRFRSVQLNWSENVRIDYY